MSALNLNALEVTFDPPLWRRARRGKRKAILLDERGTQLGGITVNYRSPSSEWIEIPQGLTVMNRPEHGETSRPLSDLDREALRGFIREKLRIRPDPPGHPERADAREQITLLRKAWAGRSGRRN